MAEKTIMTRCGRLHLFKNNPREIRDSAFNRLVESVRDMPHFLELQEIVVWLVPEKLDDGPDGKPSPFKGQEGQLIVLSGNQRVKGLIALGNKDIPDSYVKEAKVNGEWISAEDAEIFVNLANGDSAIAGDFNYDKLKEKFDEFRMKMAGIDFSHFVETMKAEEKPEELEGDVDKEVEEGEHGEDNEDLDAFKKEREKTRKDVHLVDEVGFYLVLIFDTFDDKAKFISESGIAGNEQKCVMADDGNYLVLVFESHDQKDEFIRKAGLKSDEEDTEEPNVFFGMFVEGRHIAEKLGIKLSETGLHFRDRIVDNQLADMARPDAPQKTRKQIEEDIYAELKREREELGMETGGKKGKRNISRKDAEDEADAPEDGHGDDLPPPDYNDADDSPADADGEVEP